MLYPFLFTLWSCQLKKPLSNQQSNISTVIIVDELSHSEPSDVLNAFHSFPVAVKEIPYPKPSMDDEEFCEMLCIITGQYAGAWEEAPKAEIESCRLELLSDWETHRKEYQRTKAYKDGEKFVGHVECKGEFIPVRQQHRY